jgi:DNA repair protein RadC
MVTSYPDFAMLSTKELLAMTLRENSSSEIVDELVQHFNLRELTEATVCELSTIKGIGEKKSSVLLAAIELAKRLSCSTPAGEIKTIRGPQDVAGLLMNEMRYLDREHFRVLLLNTKNHVLQSCLISVGSLNSSLVHPREVFKFAIKHSAAAIILCHNHPSGSPDPSNEDIDITRRLVEAGKVIGIEVLDHVVIGDGVYVSLKERGML